MLSSGHVIKFSGLFGLWKGQAVPGWGGGVLRLYSTSPNFPSLFRWGGEAAPRGGVWRRTCLGICRRSLPVTQPGCGDPGRG